MVRLVILLLGVDYLRSYWRTLTAIGVVGTLCGSILFIDALDDALYFPINPFAWLLLIEGSATLVVAHSGIVGQRKLRYLKGLSFVTAAALILAGHHHGNFILSMIFGTLFLADGLLQIVSAYVVRYRTFRIAMFGGGVEIALAVFFFQPYPTHYIGTVPYCLGLGLFFAGWNMLLVAGRARRMISNPALNEDADRPMPGPGHTEQTTCERPTGENARPLIVHIWTPLGVANAEVVRRPLIERYIAAVDKNGVISTGHAALEAPDGLYVSLTRRRTSTIHRTSSCACCGPPKITMCRENSSPITSRNHRHGALLPFKYTCVTMTRSTCRAFGRRTVKTPPITSPTAIVPAASYRFLKRLWKDR